MHQMIPSKIIVTQLHLELLWGDDGYVPAVRKRYLSQPLLCDMLRQFPVEFYVAEVGSPLRRVALADCYDFWKSEVRANVVDDLEAGFSLEDFPRGFAYVASEWSGEIGKSIVLLEVHH